MTIAALEGLHQGLILNQTKADADSLVAGRNPWLIGILQTFGEYLALSSVNKALTATGRSPIPSPFRWAIYLTPALLAYTIHRGIQHPTARRAAIFLQTHLDTLCMVAATVSSIALVYFGQLAFGIPSCIVLGIGYLDRNGILPLKVRQWIHHNAPHLMVATSLFVGDPIDRIFCFLYFASLCAQYYLERRQEEVATLPNNLLSISSLQEIQGKELHVNRNYIHVPCLPLAPNITLKTLLPLFEQIDWNRHIDVVRLKLKYDGRFTDIEGNPDDKTDEELIAFVKTSFHSYINAVEKREIKSGEPTDYSRLETYLKLVASGLQVESNEVTRAGIFLILAIEAGDYCGPGLYGAAEKAYTELYGNLHIPLEMKVLNCLQDVRNLWMEASYSGMFHLQERQGAIRSSFYKVLAPEDQHTYNTFVNVFGRTLGLRNAAASNDEMASVGPLTQLIVAAFYEKKIQQRFWEEHTPYWLSSALSEAIGTARIPKSDVYDWWRNWIERQEISSTDKESLKEKLSNGFLFGMSLERKGKITPYFARLMLLDMGIFTVEPEQIAQ